MRGNAARAWAFAPRKLCSDVASSLRTGAHWHNSLVQVNDIFSIIQSLLLQIIAPLANPLIVAAFGGQSSAIASSLPIAVFRLVNRCHAIQCPCSDLISPYLHNVLHTKMVSLIIYHNVKHRAGNMMYSLTADISFLLASSAL